MSEGAASSTREQGTDGARCLATDRSAAAKSPVKTTASHLVSALTLHPFPDDFAPYDRDASKATTGTDNLFRLSLDAEGYVAGRVICLSLEEAESYRKEHRKTMPYLRKQAATPPKKVRKRNKKTQPTESKC